MVGIGVRRRNDSRSLPTSSPRTSCATPTSAGRLGVVSSKGEVLNYPEIAKIPGAIPGDLDQTVPAPAKAEPRPAFPAGFVSGRNGAVG